ncbi:hypothetical protein AVEN_56445-1 [Araneus ventricosus]|uniref:Uncharacterized protein n=1 Tax=Araneus ventricosus TaxID=182803 RepID=A0A4Y2NH59_ARAVE|nr:hypothetical protein AVEN_56445-1 [Araneus ventricosus]
MFLKSARLLKESIHLDPKHSCDYLSYSVVRNSPRPTLEVLLDVFSLAGGVENGAYVLSSRIKRAILHIRHVYCVHHKIQGTDWEFHLEKLSYPSRSELCFALQRKTNFNESRHSNCYNSSEVQ